MSNAGIYLAIDGQPVDLSEISWYEKAPCGCVCGVHVAYSDYGGSPSIVIPTAEQAAAEMWPTTHEREKYQARLGFTVFADLTSKCRELLTTECPHEPRFGVPPRPEVDGHLWAAVHDAVSRPKLMHLVPEAAVKAAQNREYGTRHRPLCGGKEAFWWSTEWYALDGKVECSRCWKKADR